MYHEFKGSFTPGETYYPAYVLTPTAGYSFTENVNVHFTDGFETVSQRYEDGDLIVYGPPYTVPYQIDRVDVTFTEPVAGAHPDFNVSTSTNNVNLSTPALITPHGTGLEFLDPTLNDSNHLLQIMNPDDTFIKGNTYTAIVQLETSSASNLAFSPNLEVYFNGKKADVTSKPNGLLNTASAQLEYTVEDEIQTDSDSEAESDTEQTDTEIPTDTDETTDTDSSIIGDVTGDGKVTMEDVVMLQKYIAELVTFTDMQKVLGDVTGDGAITMLDVTTMQKFIAELIDVFPAELK